MSPAESSAASKQPAAPPLATGLRVLFAVAALVVVVGGLRAAAAIVVPLLVSVFVAMICAPALRWLQKRGMPAALAIFVLMAVLFVVGAVLLALVGASVASFSQHVDVYEDRLEELFDSESNRVLKLLERWKVHVPSGTEPQIDDLLDTGVGMDLVTGLLTGLMSAFSNAFFILLTVVFILLEASEFPAKLRAAYGGSDEALVRFERIMHNVQSYMAIKAVVSLMTAVLATIWLKVLGIDYALLWGVLAFFLNFVPNIGSILAAAPAVALGLVQYDLATAGLVAVGYLAINLVLGNMVEPRWMGRGLGLSTLVVFLSLVFWGWVLGPVGMILSVPLTIVAKIVLEGSRETRWIAILLGNETPAVES